MASLVDSDYLIDHIFDTWDASWSLADLREDGFAVSAVTYMETYEGVLRFSDVSSERAKFDELFSAIPVLPFFDEVALRCAQLRRELRMAGRSVRPRSLDLIIVATALHYGMALVTRNPRDYSDIPGLTLYDPARPPTTRRK